MFTMMMTFIMVAIAATSYALALVAFVSGRVFTEWWVRIGFIIVYSCFATTLIMDLSNIEEWVQSAYTMARYILWLFAVIFLFLIFYRLEMKNSDAPSRNEAVTRLSSFKKGRKP